MSPPTLAFVFRRAFPSYLHLRHLLPPLTQTFASHTYRSLFSCLDFIRFTRLVSLALAFFFGCRCCLSIGFGFWLWVVLSYLSALFFLFSRYFTFLSSPGDPEAPTRPPSTTFLLLTITQFLSPAFLPPWSTRAHTRTRFSQFLTSTAIAGLKNSKNLTSGVSWPATNATNERSTPSYPDRPISIPSVPALASKIKHPLFRRFSGATPRLVDGIWAHGVWMGVLREIRDSICSSPVRVEGRTHAYGRLLRPLPIELTE
ncbi:hypothetical protein A7U60_g1752 [Sanghuangporus baumii]|uniref:Uncharacterized protein n=1 Tax=Sanghuangporus baumii TaxID=108892 RepID=A0A9Q5N8U8_SANBA|nr:hypothetical protein A7U60_g1752 [Sanghuangporus baumii]